MFFKKLFNRDSGHYLTKGDSLFASGRYAEARGAFQDALQHMDGACSEEEVRGKIADCGDRLALLNLTEAEHAINSGDLEKAADHLRLASELAEDVTIREKAEKLLRSLEITPAAPKATSIKKSCSTCASDGCETTATSDFNEVDLPAAMRFELAVQTLPGDLPVRYMELGENFARGYLSAIEGDDALALSIFQDLMAEGENDITLYETALIQHRSGDKDLAEKLLREALTLNPSNPLVYLALVQLLTEGDQFDEAVHFLTHMVENRILPDQACLMLGDICRLLGNKRDAVDYYSRALSSPLKKEAAERLIPVLEEENRSAEAKEIYKHFLKGCC